MKKIYIEDAAGESIEKSGFKILDFLAGETHFYKYGLNLHDPDGKALFHEYDKVQDVYDMKKWTMVNQRFASEGWVYPKRNEEKRKAKILRLVEMWKEKGYKVDDSELKAFINDRTTNETLYMTSK